MPRHEVETETCCNTLFLKDQ